MKRLYHAVCSLIESKADHLTARAEYTRRPDKPEPEPQPAGTNSQNQVTGKYEPNDMRAGFHRTGIGFTRSGSAQDALAAYEEEQTRYDTRRKRGRGIV